MKLRFSAAVVAAIFLVFPVAAPAAPCGVYLWQRQRDDAFAEAAREALDEGRACFVFSGEWNGEWRGPLPPADLLSSPRVTPVFRFFERALSDPGTALRALARRLAEFPAPPRRLQLDCDAPESKLAAYAAFLRAARGLLPESAELSATFLPAHLGRAGLEEALAAVDFAVVQVHGLLAPESFSSPASLMTRGSVEKALAATAVESKWRLSVPSYALVASFDGASGRFLRFRAEPAGEPLDPVPPAGQDGSLAGEGKRFRLLAPDGDLLADIFSRLPRERILWFRWPARGERWVLPAGAMRAYEAGKRPGLALSLFAEPDGAGARILARWNGGIPFGAVPVRLRWEPRDAFPREWFPARANVGSSAPAGAPPETLLVPPFAPGVPFALGSVLPATPFAWERADGD